jgi:hypothetical protein
MPQLVWASEKVEWKGTNKKPLRLEGLFIRRLRVSNTLVHRMVDAFGFQVLDSFQ